MTGLAKLAAVAAAVLVALVVAGAAVLVRKSSSGRKTITAYFTTATAIYPGDEVRVVRGQGRHHRLHRAAAAPGQDDPQGRPRRARSGRRQGGDRRPESGRPPATSSSRPPTRQRADDADGAVIPVDRTAVPVEWDEVKEQLMRLATELGPGRGVSTGTRSAGSSTAPPTRWTATATSCGRPSAQLSGVGRILADGSGNIVDIIKNLQTFVTALRDSNDQIVQFQDRLATLDQRGRRQQVRPGRRAEDLSEAVGEVQRFIAGTRDKTASRSVGQRHTEPGRPPHGPGKHPAHRAECARQLLQQLQRRHRNHRGRVRAR